MGGKEYLPLVPILMRATLVCCSTATEALVTQMRWHLERDAVLVFEAERGSHPPWSVEERVFMSKRREENNNSELLRQPRFASLLSADGWSLI